MKKNLLYLLLTLCFCTACSDDDGTTWRDLPVQEIAGSDLTLATNGQPQVNAGVTLTMTDERSGTLTLRSAGLGLDKVEVPVTVKGEEGGEVYRIEGFTSVATTNELAANTKLNLSGTVTTDGRAIVDVTAQSSGDLVRQWQLCDKLHTATGDPKRRPYAPAHVYMLSTYNDGVTAENVSNLGSGLLSALIVKLLKDVEFKPDGNIIATFGKKPSIEMADYISGVLGALPSTSGVNWTTSPSDFAYWFVGANRIYVQLNYSNLIGKIAGSENAATRTGVVLSELLEALRGMGGAEIKNLLAQLIENADPDKIWSKLDINRISDADVEKLVGYLLDGIPLCYEQTTVTKADGTTIENLYVYLDKEIFDILMPMVYPLLPEIDVMLDNLDVSILGTPVGTFIKQMLGLQSMTDFEQVWKQTSVFKLGLDIATGSHKE